MKYQLSLFNNDDIRAIKEDQAAFETLGWSLDQIIQNLQEIKSQGFISIPSNIYRKDEGVVGQILERKFNVRENNLSVRDLGSFELKGIRSTSHIITLCHKKPIEGSNPIQIFDRFGQITPSNRDSTLLKKKFFSTINGTHVNRQGLQLIPDDAFKFSMFHISPGKKEFICRWDLQEQIRKIDNIILVSAKTQGDTNSPDEKFHYTDAWILNGIKRLDSLIKEGVIVVDFCIDQSYISIHGPAIGIPHDRGPHIRIPRAKLLNGYNRVIKIL